MQAKVVKSFTIYARIIYARTVKCAGIIGRGIQRVVHHLHYITSDDYHYVTSDGYYYKVKETQNP